MTASAVDRKLIGPLLQAYGLEKSNAELEVRLRGVTPDLFRGAYQAALAAGLVFRESQTVNSIEDYLRSTKSHITSQVSRTPNYIWTVLFEAGRRAGDRFTAKMALYEPQRLQAAGMETLVAASSERPLNTQPAVSDSCLVRVKRRHSAEALLDKQTWAPGAGRWRLDFTVVAQLSGAESRQQLVPCLDLMFRQDPPPALPDTRLPAALLPAYEIEAEWVGEGPPTDADVVAAAGALAALVPEEIRFKEGIESEIKRLVPFLGVKVAGRRARLKAVLPQVVNLTATQYAEMYPPVGLLVTDKADGQRAVAHLGPAPVILTGQSLLRPRPVADRTIVDGELVKNVFYAFDVMAVPGVSLAGAPFEERIRHLDAAVAQLCASGVEAAAKQYVRLEGDPAALEAQIQPLLDKKQPYEKDGLIFVKPGECYADTSSWKWKPPECNTIDFLARLVPGKKTDYYLFVGANRAQFEARGGTLPADYDTLFGPAMRSRPYIPVLFEPLGVADARPMHLLEGAPAGLDGTVVELLPTSRGWQFVRQRLDRSEDLESGTYFGNDHHVAMTAWINYLSPLLPSELWNGPDAGYFRVEGHSNMYSKQIAAVSELKLAIIQDYYRGAPLMVDLACGRGQDVNKLARNGVRQLIGVDQDAAALAEFARRVLSPGGPRGGIRIQLLRSGLLADGLSGKVLALAGGRPAAGVQCNLALHYVMGSTEQIGRLAAFVALLTGPGSVFSAVVMDGGRVHAHLAGCAQGASWDLKEDGAVKFSLRRDYASDELTAAGQQIGVLLPFSQGKYYEEFLVPAETLVAVFGERGFRLKESRTISTDGHSSVDAEYLKLFVAHVFERQ